MYALNANTQTTFLEDVWNYIKSVFFSSDSGYYENLGFEKSPLFSFRLMVLGIFIGAIIACVAMAYNKQVLGNAVRKIIAEGATSKENAKTLSELGYDKSFFIRNAVRSGVSLRKVVKCVEEEEYYAEQRREEEEYEQKRKDNPSLPKFKAREYMVDVNTAHFYIPEEIRIRAEIRFEKKGSGWITSIVGVVLLCVILFLLLLAMPLILGGINDLVGFFKG